MYPDSKVDGATMGPISGRQVPGGAHIVPMNWAGGQWWAFDKFLPNFAI